MSNSSGLLSGNGGIPTLNVRSVNPDHAAEIRHISHLYSRVYGDTFPVHDVVSDAFWRTHIGSRYMSLVAELNGEVIAHLSVHRDRIDPSIVEVAYPVYDPRFEDHLPEILARTWAVLERQRTRQGWRMLYYFSLAQRSESQLLGSALLNTYEVAICPGYLPHNSSSNSGSLKSALGLTKRCDVIVNQRFFAPDDCEAQALYAPERHRKFIEFLYAPTGLKRSFSGAKESRVATPVLSADSPAVERQFFRRTGVRQSFVRPSLLGSPKELLNRLSDERQEGSYLYLDLTDPKTPSMAEAVEALGFRFGGVLPLFKGTDSVVYFFERDYRPVLDELSTPRAKAIAEYITGVSSVPRTKAIPTRAKTKRLRADA
jgi:hypothetical protein